MSAPAVDTRRSFVRRVLQAGAWMACGGGGAYGYGNQIERRSPVVERVNIGVRGLGGAWNGARIVQLSDLHLEPIVDQELLRTTVGIVNALKPDLILLTGDYVTSIASRAAHLVEPLTELRAAAGVYGCLGNHDVGAGRERVRQALEQHGITCLINRGLDFARGGEHLWLAGLDSAWGGWPQLIPAMKGRPQGAPAIVLMHEPDYADLLARANLPVLQLSGHTHGGQCCLPGGMPVHLPKWGKKYPKGLFDVGPVQLYVNRGLGCIGVPLRFACPPEITEITLTSV